MKRHLILFACVAFTLPLWAWGMTGHRVVAEVAYHYMNKKTIRQVDAVLGSHGAVYWSTWADDIKSEPSIYGTSYDWHFQDMPEGLSDSAIMNYVTNYPTEGGRLYMVFDQLYAGLKNKQNSIDVAGEKVSYHDALMFLIHLTGDRFCPMHNGRMDDKGGNTVSVNWFGKNTNLHRVWDNDIISSQMMNYTEYAQYLIDTYDSEFGGKKSPAGMATNEQIAVNTYHLVEQIYAYQATFDGNAYHYTWKWKQYCDWQLYAAGVKLAYLLNELYK